MKFVALCLLVVGIAGCKTNNRNGAASHAKLTFVSSANCSCYQMEQDYLAKNPPADEPYGGATNADSQDGGAQSGL